MLPRHYRSQLNYTQYNLEQANAAIQRLYTALRGLTPEQPDENLRLPYWNQFTDAMNDDFNAPEAMSVLFELVREINKARDNDVVRAAQLAHVLVELADVLGLLQQSPESFLQGGADDEVALIEALIAQRNKARAEKDWAAADEARDRLTEMGIVLEDGANGTQWRRS